MLVEKKTTKQNQPPKRTKLTQINETATFRQVTGVPQLERFLLVAGPIFFEFD